MRGILTIVAILMIALVACTAPPEEIQEAQVNTPDETSDEHSEEDADDHEDASDDHEESVEESETQDPVEESEPSENEVIETDSGLELVPIDLEKSTFEFEGYGPGKSHVGTFDEMSGSLTFGGDKLVAAEGVIQVASVNTGMGGLDDHLKAADFFDVENHPEITIVSTSIEYTSETEAQVTGDLTLLGVTNELSFPATVSSEGISAEVRFDTTPWGFVSTGVNKEVRVAFDLKR